MERHTSALPRNLLSAASAALFCLAVTAVGSASASERLPEPAATDVCGSIASDAVWPAAGSPYRVCGAGLTVQADSTLTIQPGAEVRFEVGSRLVVKGALDAEGSALQPIRFTSNAAAPAAGDWYSIEVWSGGSARLGSCEIAYAGRSGSAALWVGSSDVQAEHCAVHHSGGRGVTVEGSGLAPRFEDVQVTDGAGNAIWQRREAYPVYANVTITRNAGLNGVVLEGGTWRLSGTWDGAGLNGSPLVVSELATVGPTTTVTVTAGTKVAFVTGTWLAVQGGLAAEGSVARPVTFTSAQAAPAAGDWYSIDVQPGARARLSDCDIAYGGRLGGAMLWVKSSDVQVTRCAVHHSGGRGVTVEGSGLAPRFEDVQVTDNAGNAIWQRREAYPVYANVTITRNAVYNGVVLEGGTWRLSGTWDGTELNGSPLVVSDLTTVGPTTTMTVAAGTKVGFVTGTWLAVQGGLAAEGSVARPVTFTSAQAAPAAGDWYSIDVQPGGRARLSDCDIAYGGRLGWAMLWVKSSDVRVTRCAVHHSGGRGVTVEGSGLAPRFEDVRATDNAGHPIWQRRESYPAYANVTITRNAVLNGVVLEGGTWGLGGTWDGTGLNGSPLVLNELTTVGPAATVTVAAGTKVAFVTGVWLRVQGGLAAEGSAARPVTFTSAQAAPAAGDWYAVEVWPGGRARFSDCEVAYGGRLGNGALAIWSSEVTVQRCAIRDSAGSGIRITSTAALSRNLIVGNVTGVLAESGAQPLLRDNVIMANRDYGVRNLATAVTVNATLNYWGSLSGPYHPTRNPTGAGDRVSDGVSFVPWLQYPPAGMLTGQMFFRLFGPGRISPGQLAEYSIAYANLTSGTLPGVVLAVNLPQTADYVESAPAGQYWPQRHQVFWKLGDLAPGAAGDLLFRVRFWWGVPNGTQDSAMLLAGGASIFTDAIRVAEYLAYTPTLAVSRTMLTPAQVAAERAAHPAYDALYAQALADGFQHGTAARYLLNDGRLVTQTVLLALSRSAARYLSWVDGRALASSIEGNTFAMRDGGGGMSWDMPTDVRTYWGSWATDAWPDAAAVPEAFSPRACEGAGCCMKNCLAEVAVTAVVGRIHKILNAALNVKTCVEAAQAGTPDALAECAAGLIEKVPFLGEIAGVVKCAASCAGDPNSQDCKGPLITCEAPWYDLYRWIGVPHKTVYECGSSGCYLPKPNFIPCAFGEKCVPGKGCVDCGEGNVDCKEHTVAVARDPNAKVGPAGDLLPGQGVTYTILYENEGAGQAYGVFIIDALSEHFDPASVAATGGASYDAASRLLSWDIGELAPKGQPGSAGAVTVTARLTGGLPSGTAIVNQADVYFPSVPEKTPTNAVVNVIRPLLAVPQRVEVEAGRALPITLSGSDAGGATLAYAVVARPEHGSLGGIAPRVVYTPMAGYSGGDRFTFRVSNAVTSSLPAEVSILVRPSAADITRPVVVWTWPAAGQVVTPVSAVPVLTDTAGPAYAPFVAVQFSEPVSPATVSAQTVRLRTGAGQLVSATVGYDPVLRQAVLAPRGPVAPVGRYVASVGPEVKDLAGNAMASEHRWDFFTGAAGPVPRVHIPIVRRH